MKFCGVIAGRVLLTHWGEDKMASILQTAYSNAAYSGMWNQYFWKDLVADNIL